METTCISTKIFTAVNLGDGQNVHTPFARFVEEVVLAFYLVNYHDSPAPSLCVVAVRCCFIVQDCVCGTDRQPFAVRIASDDLGNGLGLCAFPSFRI